MLSYKELSEAYNDRCLGNIEPTELLISAAEWENVRHVTDYWSHFNAAKIILDLTLDVPYKFIGGVEPGAHKKEFML